MSPSRSRLLRLALLCPTLLAPLAAASADVASLRIAAAAVDRAGVVATFRLAGVDGTAATVAGNDGTVLPAQRIDADTWMVVVPAIAAGASPAYAFRPAAPAGAGVAAVRTAEGVAVRVGGQPVLDYWLRPEPLPNTGIDPKFLRSGHLHPIRTPAGVVISSSYAPNHLHHHGIWSPWAKTNFQGRKPDFWNMGDKTGTVEAVAVDRTWEGPVAGGFVSRQRFVDLSAPTPVTALDESWTLTAYSLPAGGRPAFLFDLEIDQRCATADPLVLLEYHYGGLGFRGHDQWNGADGAHFLTSEGLTDRVKAHATRARWCHVGGRVDGRPAGIGILGHPGNFRAPQPMRIHPTEPFFCFAPPQLGESRIEPGRPYVARYRFVVLDGEADAALLEAYWNGYAQPAVVTIEPSRRP